MKKALLTLLLMLLMPLGVCAETDTVYEQQLQASGAQQLIDSLPEETRQLLHRLGISGWQDGTVNDVDVPETFSTLGDLLSSMLRAPVAAASLLLGAAMLCGWLRGAQNTLRTDSLGDIYGFLCDIAVCACLLTPLYRCVVQTQSALQSMAVFMVSFLPVFAGVLVTDGYAVTAASYQTLLLVAAQGITLLANTWLTPLMSVSLTCGTTGALTPGMHLHRVGTGINKAVAWVVGLTATIFTGLLSVKNLLGAAADSVGGRAMRFSIGSLVPVVGSSLGEAFDAVRNCLGMLRTGIGCFGMFATAGIILPPLLQCVAWSVVLAMCEWVAQVLDLPMLSSLLQCGRSTVRTLIALLCACALVMIVATALVTAAAGGR